MVVIRGYTDSDYDGVIGLWTSVGLYIPSSDKRSLLRQKIEFSPGSIILAEDDERIVGSVAVVLDPWMATIFRLAVSEDYRNKGLGRGLAVQLMEEAEKRVREVGAETVGCYVAKGRGASREKSGYRFFGTYDCLEKTLSQ